MYCGQNFKFENFRLSFGKVYDKACVAQIYFFLNQANYIDLWHNIIPVAVLYS